MEGVPTSSMLRSPMEKETLPRPRNADDEHSKSIIMEEKEKALAQWRKREEEHQQKLEDEWVHSWDEFIDLGKEDGSLNVMWKPDLKDIPPPPFEVAGLKAIRLIGLNLTMLPDAFGPQHSSLTNLNLSNNRLETLPETIKYMTNLKEVNLMSNRLQSLPESFSTFTKLEKLEIAGNQIKHLPKGIGNLTGLKRLNLDTNM